MAQSYPTLFVPALAEACSSKLASPAAHTAAPACYVLLFKGSHMMQGFDLV